MIDDAEKGPLGKLVDAAQDAVGGVVGMASAAVAGGSTAGFVQAATIADLYEVAAGSLAIEMGSTEVVRAFGSTLVDDHQKSLTLLRSKLAGAQLEDELPAELDERRAGMIDNLRSAGSDFDQIFLQQQTLAHQEAIALHKHYAQSGDDPALRGLADGMIPNLEQHARMAEKLATERAV